MLFRPGISIGQRGDACCLQWTCVTCVCASDRDRARETSQPNALLASTCVRGCETCDCKRHQLILWTVKACEALHACT